MKLVVGAVITAAVIAGCGSSSAPPPTAPATPAHDVTASSPPPPPQMPRHEVTLTAQVPVTLNNGVTLTLVTVLDAHVTARDGTSGNELTCVLDIRKDHDAQTVTLTRLTTTGLPPASQEVLGARLALLSVDAYHQPATANLLVDP